MAASATTGPVAAAAPGFGPPRPLAAPYTDADSLQAKVAPTGRTVVLWRSLDDGPRWRSEYVVAIGDRPSRLGPTSVVPGGSSAADTADYATLLAFPDGAFAACFVGHPDPGVAVAGCSFAPRNGRFGPFRKLAHETRGGADFSMVARPDGRVAVLSTWREPSAKLFGRLLSLSPSGDVAAGEDLGVLRGNPQPGLVALDDGTLVLRWATERVAETGIRTPTLRLIQPGSDAVAPPTPFTPDAATVVGVHYTGGRQLVAAYTATTGGERVVIRRPDGTFAAPQTLPRPSAGMLTGDAVVERGGETFAVSTATKAAAVACRKLAASVVGAGPLGWPGTPSTAQQLSTTGQIAEFAQGASLEDGTRLVFWGNSFNNGRQHRLEIARQAPGAARFERPQVLPLPARYEATFASGGNQALAAWRTGASQDGPTQVVVSAYNAGTLAPPAPRPSSPSTRCQ